MKALYSKSNLNPFLTFLGCSVFLISCGTYQGVSHGDGIYEDESTASRTKKVVILNQKEYSKYDNDYFAEELALVDDLKNDDIFLDADDYNSIDTVYVEDGNMIDYSPNQPWGSGENNDVVVNINMNPNPYWNTGWGVYNGWGFNNWNWRWRNRWAFGGGFYDPFWSPGYAWGWGVYDPYFYGNYPYRYHPYRYNPYRYNNYRNSRFGRRTAYNSFNRGDNRYSLRNKRTIRSTRNNNARSVNRSARTTRNRSASTRNRIESRTSRNTRTASPTRSSRSTRVATPRTSRRSSTPNRSVTPNNNRSIRSSSPSRNSNTRSSSPSRSSNTRSSGRSASRSSGRSSRRGD